MASGAGFRWPGGTAHDTMDSYGLAAVGVAACRAHAAKRPDWRTVRIGFDSSMTPTTKPTIGRLALRVKGDDWIAYALSDSMADAVPIASIKTRFIRNAARKEAFAALARACLDGVATIMPALPTATQIQSVANAAAQIHGEDPIATIQGARDQRGRFLALAVLIEAFPSAPRYKLAGFCGFGRSSTKAASNLTLARRSDWWRDDDLALVKAALGGESADADVAKSIFAASTAVEKIDLPIASPIDLQRLPLVTPPPRIFDRTKGSDDPDLSGLADHGKTKPQRAARPATVPLGMDGPPPAIRGPSPMEIAFTTARRKSAVPLPPEAYGDPSPDFAARRAEAEERGKREKAQRKAAAST
jgi:hypothetical protein